MSDTPKPTQGLYRALVVAFLAYSIILGTYVATRPKWRWRSPFSFHPLLMTWGLIGCAGLSAVTKKMGGYQNTKNHGLLAMLGAIFACGGLYAIYHNKNLYERPHFTSYHGKIGLLLVISSVAVGLIGAIFLHPDFGMDKTNQKIRRIHKMCARVMLASAWALAFQGVTKVSNDPVTLTCYGLPLLLLAPFTLI